MRQLHLDPKAQQVIVDEVINGVSHASTSQPAFLHLIEKLKGYGNQPGPEQMETLAGTMKAYTDMVQRKLNGRYALPLPTGFGKTQSIIAWVSQLYKSGITDKSVAVCASKVEELCSIKRELIAEGVPDEHIGLFHSYRYDQETAEAYLNGEDELPPGYASMPSTDKHQEKQILLVTHNRVRGKSEVDQFNLFQGKERDLMIWDESLFIADARGVVLKEVKAYTKWLNEMAGDQAKIKPVVQYLEKCVSILDKEMNAQQKKSKKPRIVCLPELSRDKIENYKEAISRYKMLDILKDFLDISQSEFRVIPSIGSNSGAITYEIKVPKELKNILVLDASYDIRKLSKANVKHINESPWANKCGPYIEPEKARLDYSNVTIHHLKHGSGRDTVSKIQESPKQECRLVSQEVAEVVKDIPENEAVLIFTFKTRPSDKVNFIETLKRDLQGRGIDTEAQIQLNDGTIRPRFVWLTWGQETARNEYSYCSNVIFAGVLHRSYLDLSASTAGENEDLTVKIDQSDLSETRNSEVAHCIYQALSRGASRKVSNGVAGKSNVYLIHNDRKIKDLLDVVMPEAKWVKWEGKFLTKEPTKAEDVQEAVKAFLATYEGQSISVQKLKKEAGLSDVQRHTFNRALTKALEGTANWKKQKQSIVREKAEDYGFKSD
jgi:hypothetical protein